MSKKKVKKKYSKEKIKHIKCFFEQQTYFFMLLLIFIGLDYFFKFNYFFKYSVVVAFTGWALSLLLQEAFVYDLFKPIFLTKKWDKFMERYR